MKWLWNRCRRRQEISLLAAGTLRDEEKIEVERHLAACQECRSYYGQIKTLIAPLAGWEKRLSVIEATPAAQRRWAKALHESGSGLPPLLQNIWRILWHELLWPSRYAWTGLTALWVAMLVINGHLADPRMSGASARAASSQDMLQAWVEQTRVLAELAQPALGMPIPPPHIPGPRSQRKQNWAII